MIAFQCFSFALQQSYFAAIHIDVQNCQNHRSLSCITHSFFDNNMHIHNPTYLAIRFFFFGPFFLQYSEMPHIHHSPFLLSLSQWMSKRHDLLLECLFLFWLFYLFKWTLMDSRVRDCVNVLCERLVQFFSKRNKQFGL